MANLFTYNNRGVANYVPGCLTHSDSYQETGFFPYTSPIYASTNVPVASFPVSTTTAFTITQNSTQLTSSGNVVVGTVANAQDIANQINGFLLNQYTASVVGTNIVISTNITGAFGAFTLTVAAATIANTVVPGADSELIAGRFVVPVTNNLDTSLGVYSSEVRYRYPVLTDNAAILASGGFVVYSGQTNKLLNPVTSDDRKVTNGTCFPVLKRGQIIISPLTTLLPANSLFVDTATANAGVLANAASATRLAIPVGKIAIVSGTNTARANVEARILY